MAETCIVCLSDLRLQGDQQHQAQLSSAPAVANNHDDDASNIKKRSLRNTRLTSKSIDDDDEIVAHLLPCKHNLHNACLKPWVERANSCPICRAVFNTVELSAAVGGEVIDTYAVQDKVQEAEFDPAVLAELYDGDLLDLDDPLAPCTICDMIDESHEVMYCDGCDSTVHVFCAGYTDMPDVWHCMECLASSGPTTLRLGTSRRAARLRGLASGDDRSRRSDMVWARVWQEVSRRLDLDLDFPYDDTEYQRTDEQRREFNRWQRRFQVADRQGSARRLRGVAARLQPQQPVSRPIPESQEEIRAWNAFEKARESQDAATSVQTRRKRPRSESPQSERNGTDQQQQQQQRQLKRPRLRRPPTNTDVHTDIHPHAESSSSAAQRAEEPTFLSSLLREVEQKPVSAASPGASEGVNGQQSPRNLSPVRSPSSSGHATPRALSVTSANGLPKSPPLCSTIAPPMSPLGLTFFPFSPTDTRPESELRRHQRGRAIDRIRVGMVKDLDQEATSSTPQQSPERDRASRLTLASKEEIQRMVKTALRPRYREKQVTKDQYTDINRDVSRKMYEIVGDATALANEDERAKWQDIAEMEVHKAILTLVESNQAHTNGEPNES